MPEFMLNDCTAPKAYYALSDFARGYIQAMFFTNGDTGYEDEFILNRLGVERLTKEAIKSIAADCDKFLSTIMPDDCSAQQWIERANLECQEDRGGEGYTDEQAGRDFWFTRQGHGVGYLDRDLGPIGDGLDDVASNFREATVEHYHGWIYHR